MIPLLNASALTFRYPTAPASIIDRLSLSVAAGELVAVHGPSGCGKSTLLYLLGLFLRPTSGTVRLCGVDTAALGDRDRSQMRAHDIGIVLQDAALHERMTLVENVAEAALFSGRRRRAALSAARSLLDSFGLDDVHDRHPSQVSGGQAQRAALCRALIRSPRLLLADEPTGNLDLESGGAVLLGLRNAASEGSAVVVVTHSPVVIDAADRAIRLD